MLPFICKRYIERGALALPTLKGDVAAVVAHDVARKGQPYTVAAVVAVDGIGGTIEQCEQLFLRFGRNANARIAYGNNRIVAAFDKLNDDFSTITVVFYRVRYDVIQYVIGLFTVYPYQALFPWEDEAQVQGLFVKQAVAGRCKLFEAGIEVAGLVDDVGFALRRHIHFLEIQQFGSELMEVAGTVQCQREQPPVGFGQRVAAVKVAQGVDNKCYRRTYIVGGIDEKLQLVPEIAAFKPCCIVAPRAVNGQRCQQQVNAPGPYGVPPWVRNVYRNGCLADKFTRVTAYAAHVEGIVSRRQVGITCAGSMGGYGPGVVEMVH